MLLPARGRPANFRASVESVFDLAAHPDEVEVLVRLDEDDPTLQDIYAVLRDFPISASINVICSKRVGYAAMHTMYDELARRGHSRGSEWLFLWNDDIEMQTRGWDAIIREAPPHCVQFPRRDVTDTTDFTLPVVGRSVYEAIGHLSKNAYVDAWLADVATAASVAVIRDDVVFKHHRLNDQTLNEQAPAQPVEWGKFSSLEQRVQRAEDVSKIVKSPQWWDRFDGWETLGTFPTLDYLTSGAPIPSCAYRLTRIA